MLIQVVVWERVITVQTVPNSNTKSDREVDPGEHITSQVYSIQNIIATRIKKVLTLIKHLGTRHHRYLTPLTLRAPRIVGLMSKDNYQHSEIIIKQSTLAVVVVVRMRVKGAQ